MRMRPLLAAWLAALIAMAAIDALWLGVIMADTYQAWLGDLMLSTPRLLPAALFYLLYATGLTVFAMAPALHHNNWRRAALLGGLLGLVAYGTYDLSNYATLKDWPAQMTMVDIAWGGVLSSVCATVGFFCGKRFA
jgi:uncharacterized membrane protein